MAYFTPYTIVDFFSGSQRCGSLFSSTFGGKKTSGLPHQPARERREHRINRAVAEYALLGGGRFSRSVGRTLRGEKQKRSREKAAQNNQISEKTSLLVKKTRKNLHISKSSQPKMVNNDPKTRSGKETSTEHLYWMTSNSMNDVTGIRFRANEQRTVSIGRM